MTTENKPKWSKRKVLHIVLSILIACAIWLFVDSAENSEGSEKTKTIYDIPIEYIGDDTTLADRGLMLLPGSDDFITLEIKARRRVIAKLDPSKIRIQADLSDVTSTGAHSISYRVVYPNVSGTTSGFFSQNIIVVSASSYTAKVNIGELYRREVEIHCALQGNVADGYIAGELKFLPEKLEIRGPQEIVDQIAYAKVILAVNDATKTVSKLLDYQLFDSKDQLIEETDELHATADQIQVTLPVNVEKELPLKMNFIEAPGARIKNLEYTISPASITVSGEAELLRDVDSIVLDDFNLDTFSSPTTFNYAISVPDGCENLSGSTRATLTIRYKDLTTNTIRATKFTCENELEGKNVTVLTTELPVILRGTEADISAVAPDDVTVVADLSAVSAASGSYTVPATVQINTSGDVGVKGTYQVRVTISEKGSHDDEEDAKPEATPDQLA